MERKKLILLISTLFICLSFVLTSYVGSPKEAAKKLVLKQQERIFNESRFVFRPVVETLGNQSELKILVEVTSYIYDEILSLDFETNTMLEFEDSIIRPSEFTVIEKSNHKLVGQLIFNATDFVPSNQWAIKLFTFSDHEVLWN